MPVVTLQFADKVLRLHRRGFTVAAMAHKLRVAAVDVEEAHRALLLSTIDDELEQAKAAAFAHRPSAAQVEASRDRMPKKMAERQRKAELKGSNQR